MVPTTSYCMLVFAFLQLFTTAAQGPPMIRAIFKIVSTQVEISKKSVASSSTDFVAFQKCATPERLRSISYKFSVEGFDLKLQSGSCIPANRQVSWRRISLEGDISYILDDEIKYDFTKDNDLVLKNALPDLATYYSVWKLGEDEILSAVWTVEIVPIRNLELVKARSWRSSQLYNDSELEIGMKWNNWSQCSRCDGVAGRRHKFGICSVKIKSWAELEILISYKQQFSCSLLLNLKPDYLADKLEATRNDQDHEDLHHLSHALGSSPLIKVAYCRQSKCEEGLTEVIQFYPSQIQWRYYSGRRDIISKIDEKDETKSILAASSFSWIWLLKSFVHGVPISWNNLPEIIALTSLIVLQLYILKLVWWNKKYAK